jgi:hypothetical protein
MVRLMFGSKTTSRGSRGEQAQTIPGKGWNMLFRLYGPLEPWFDKTWRVGEFVLGTDAVPLISLEQLCTKIGRSKLSNLPRRATSQLQ